MNLEKDSLDLVLCEGAGGQLDVEILWQHSSNSGAVGQRAMQGLLLSLMAERPSQTLRTSRHREIPISSIAYRTETAAGLEIQPVLLPKPAKQNRESLGSGCALFSSI